METQEKQNMSKSKIALLWILVIASSVICVFNAPLYYDINLVDIAIDERQIEKNELLTMSFMSLSRFLITWIFGYLTFLFYLELPSKNYNDYRGPTFDGIPLVSVLHFMPVIAVFVNLHLLTFETIIAAVIFILKFGLIEHLSAFYNPSYRNPINLNDYSIWTPFFITLTIRVLLVCIVYGNDFFSYYVDKITSTDR
jgi:hypothetical protein